MTTYIQDLNFPITGSFQYRNVSWIKIAPSGTELYVLQRGAPAVSVWDLKGNHLRDWQTEALGCPHSLSFQVINSEAYYVWITDMAPPLTAGSYCGHCLKQFDMRGNYLGSIGTCGIDTQGTGLSPVQFDKVTDIAFDSQGYLWVSDGDINGLNNRVLQINPFTQEVVQVWSAPNNSWGNGPKEFHLPHALAIDIYDRVWIADALNSRVQVISTDGEFLQELKCFGSDGVYGIKICNLPGTELPQLFVSTSPTASPTGGAIKVFEVAPYDLPVPQGCITEFQWNIDLPMGTSEAMLHMIETDSQGEQVFLATLGGDLPPQKWMKVYTS